MDGAEALADVEAAEVVVDGVVIAAGGTDGEAVEVADEVTDEAAMLGDTVDLGDEPDVSFSDWPSAAMLSSSDCRTMGSM